MHTLILRLVYLQRDCVKLHVGYAGQSATVTDMFLEADDALFHKILHDKAHVLHSFFACMIGHKLSNGFAPDLIISLSYVKPLTSTNATF